MSCCFDDKIGLDVAQSDTLAVPQDHSRYMPAGEIDVVWTDEKGRPAPPSPHIFDRTPHMPLPDRCEGFCSWLD
jgi:hypothetical protein